MNGKTVGIKAPAIHPRQIKEERLRYKLDQTCRAALPGSLTAVQLVSKIIVARIALAACKSASADSRQPAPPYAAPKNDRDK